MLTYKKMLLAGITAASIGIAGCTGAAAPQETAPHETTSREDAPEKTSPPPEKTSAEKPVVNPPASKPPVKLPVAGKDLPDDSIQVLVNKQNSLASDYVPDDLVTVDVPTVLSNPEVNQMRKEAADALKTMFAAAKEAGYKLYARSGYRSYKTQKSLFNSYAAKNGEEAANRFSAKPGQSEHQTGLTMDVTSDSVDRLLTEEFGETEEGRWVRENGHLYGFIIRYPQDKEEITKYKYEPWHLRYLGVELATKVYESGLSYEEYLDEGDAS